jgi:plasmid stability protein
MYMCYAGVMVKRNITLSLPADLIRQAKVYAAQNDTSVNALVGELLKEKLGVMDEKDKEQIREAGGRLLELARNGPSSPVDSGTISREEIYNERLNR